MAATAVGTGLFIGTLPVTYLAGKHRVAGKVLVQQPYRYTFKRPVGEQNTFRFEQFPNWLSHTPGGSRGELY